MGNILYARLLKRGTRRQLATISAICLTTALLLLPAFFWYYKLFRTTLSFSEEVIVLAYAAVCGWLAPVAASALFLGLAKPNAGTPERLTEPLLAGTSPSIANGSLSEPPRYQPGVPVPTVFGDETPWGWLEYRNGSFHGQRLALKRAIMTIGRDENCDIWLDDDMASRHHAELTWHNGQIYFTDCESMNGILVNGRPVKRFTLLENDDLLEVGSHRFIFVLAEQQTSISEESDPLAYHQWRLDSELASGSTTGSSRDLPETRPLAERPAFFDEEITEDWKDTAEVQRQWPMSTEATPNNGGAFTIRDGEMAGRSFLLDRAVLAVGRGVESDIIIRDASISRRHAQFLRQTNGDYVQDLSSRNGTRVNDEYLTGPRLLRGVTWSPSAIFTWNTFRCL
ncbi:FHA domain-containing protein [Ktedonospora formicarum]|uniref:FHA domain-containing protein n=1 Tax=Ktedonospora formicarum TaxID=2778364 RepID=A0A8J3HTS1_9CHLR|nr:FHA domain-containing protein [Ktedonospora formicarum]GHO43847.1 hypothetical protein KSX_20100 [Ktedonospora formicarum]